MEWQDQSSETTDRRIPTVAIIVDYYYPSRRGGGVPKAVRILVKDPTASWIIITTDHDFGSRVSIPASERLTTDGEAVVDYSGSSRTNLWGLILGYRPDVVVLTSPFSRRTIRVLLARRLAQISRSGRSNPKPRVVVWSQGEMGARAMIEKRLRKTLFLQTARRFGLLKNVAWFVADQLEVEAVKSLTNIVPEVHNVGLPEPGTQPTERKKDAGQLNLIFVGRVVERKGLHLALTALQHVRGQLRFTIVGPREDHAYTQRCAALIDDLPGNIEAQFVGTLDPDGVDAILGAHHASILPTEYESFGYTIYESLSQGCVPIVSRFTPFDFDSGECDGGLHVDLTVTSVRAVLQQLVDEDAEQLGHRSDDARSLAEEMFQENHDASTIASRLAEMSS